MLQPCITILVGCYISTFLAVDNGNKKMRGNLDHTQWATNTVAALKDDSDRWSMANSFFGDGDDRNDDDEDKRRSAMMVTILAMAVMMMVMVILHSWWWWLHRKNTLSYPIPIHYPSLPSTTGWPHGLRLRPTDRFCLYSLTWPRRASICSLQVGWRNRQAQKNPPNSGFVLWYNWKTLDFCLKAQTNPTLQDLESYHPEFLWVQPSSVRRLLHENRGSCKAWICSRHHVVALFPHVLRATWFFNIERAGFRIFQLEEQLLIVPK